MLQQILRDMWVDPMLLQELDEEQKQVLFFKMREEQKRRWTEREIILEKEEKKKPPKVKQANRKGNQVKFREGEDKEVWVWVMGEHKDDKSIEEMIEEEEIKKVRLMVEEEVKRISQSNEIITLEDLNTIKDYEIDKTVEGDKTIDNDETNDVFVEKKIPINETFDNDEIFIETPANYENKISTTENVSNVNKNESGESPTSQVELSTQKPLETNEKSKLSETKTPKLVIYNEQTTSRIYPSKPKKSQEENKNKIENNLTNQISKNCSNLSNVHIYPASGKSQKTEKKVSNGNSDKKEIESKTLESKPKTESFENKNITADKKVQNEKSSTKSNKISEHKPSNIDTNEKIDNCQKVEQEVLKKPSMKSDDKNKNFKLPSNIPKVQARTVAFKNQDHKMASKVEQAKLDLKSLKEKRMAEEIEKVKLERMRSLQRAGKGSKAVLMGWINQEKKAKQLEQEKRNLVKRVREENKKEKETSAVEMRKVINRNVFQAERGLRTESQIIEFFDEENIKNTHKTPSQALKRPKNHVEVMEWFEKSEVPKGVTENSSKFLYSNLDRKESEILLKRKPPGSFLIRLSHQLFAYALSVKVNKRTKSKSRKVKHFLIEPRPVGYQFFGTNQPLFPTLDLFVQHYKNNPLSIISPLKLTIECGEAKDIEEEEEEEEDSDVENYYEM